ncbi:uncharacterized protein TNCV_2144771 [Trichonephila clavipes]|nr:uncharacterized protein TNCV_2144771 [Trichonephila clavipes]
MISIYERKILRFIFGRIQENRMWRRSKLEHYQTYKESDIVNFIKTQQIKWAGNDVRMDKNRTTKSFQCPTNWLTKKGQAKSWIDSLEKDLLVLRTKKWTTLARRLAWKRFTEKAKPPGLSIH